MLFHVPVDDETKKDTLPPKKTLKNISFVSVQQTIEIPSNNIRR